ncbi:1-acylglycerol-3-phosphate O-acyltransferase SLC1 [Sporobolomyces salmoneus]|uniref:1-acylglycerol-3-phosphate O-acyltransferase SLC1 n=1 Tax=Sporobolomyces salmoneus TaxID=183962 RepID=UPI00317F4102
MPIFGAALIISIVALPLLHYAPRTASIALASLLPTIMLSRVFSPVRYYLRLTTFLLGLAANSAWGVVVSVAMSLVGKSMNINWVVARSFRMSTAPLCGVTFKVEGQQHLDENRPAVLVGNHQTMLDILYLGAVFPKGASIMAKKELQWMPLLGQFMTLSNAVFVNRSKRADAVAIFAKVAQTMKKKSLSLFIFPEGTRSASPVPSLLPFKKGAFHLAVQAQLPIVPIVCENYAGIYSSKEKRFNSGEIVVRVLPPISTVGITSSSEDITKLTEKTRDAMLEAIEDLGRKRQEANNRIAGKAGKKALEENGERQRLLSEDRTPASS